MRKMSRFLALAVLGVTVTGCANKELAAVKSERDQLKTDLGEALVENQQLRKTNFEQTEQIGYLVEKVGQWEFAYNTLSSDYAMTRAQLDELNRTYAEAVDNWEKFGLRLPPTMIDELTSLAAQYSDLVEFDEKRGMLKFKSDFSFAPGSAELTPKAKQAVATLAKILSSDPARPFELMIAGHTDAMPVSRPETIRAGHRNNWYLSAHRAIAVGSELQAQKISPRRLAMVGYAEQRPLATNETAAGRERNRRVEVLILPSKLTDQTPVVWTRPSTTPTRTTPQQQPRPGTASLEGK